MASNSALPAGFVLDSAPQPYTTPPDSGAQASAGRTKVVMDVPASTAGALPAGFVLDSAPAAANSNAPDNSPKGVDLAAIANAAIQPLKTMGMYGPLAGPILNAVSSLASPQAQPTPGYTPSAVPALDPINAAVNKFTNALPVVGPALTGIGNQVDAAFNNILPGMQHETPQDRAQIDAKTEQAYPTQSSVGEFLGPAAGYGLLGSYFPGAMGLTGSPLQQIATSAGSTFGVQTADNMARGQSPMQAMQNAIAPSAVAGAFPLVGGAVQKFISEPAAAAITNMRQRGVTNRAIAAAPTSSELKGVASQAFDASTGGDAPALQPTSIDRFVGNVRDAVAKYRINSNNDPEAVGLLKKLVRLQKDARKSGVVVDLKDLHLLRQAAGDVAQSHRGRDSAVGSIVISKLDDFIKSLKPADILGARNPAAASKALMGAISGWARAQKVGLIEKAIKSAETYASGTENGLRHAFLRLMKSKDFSRFTPAEQQAIREAAKGTTMSNILRAIGKLGFSFGGHTGNNIIGGTIGAGLSSAALGFLGPAAPVAGAAASMAASAAARRASEAMAVNSANRAAHVFATPNIPNVSATTAPSILPQLINAAGLGTRAYLAQNP